VPRLTVSCGGHPPPLLLHADGAVEEIGEPGTLLGLVPDLDLQDRSFDLAPGDAVVAYTDGLTEAQAPERLWSPDELAATLAAARGQTAAAIVEHLVAEALDGLPAPRDDVAVLALRLLPQDS
jgi:sigma-B regulation protein RsbU (phosphoserine phosphatase)